MKESSSPEGWAVSTNIMIKRVSSKTPVVIARLLSFRGYIKNTEGGEDNKI